MARFSFWPDFAFMVQTDMSELIRDPVTFGGIWAIDVLKVSKCRETICHLTQNWPSCRSE